MRMLFAVLVLIQLQIVNGTSGFALADNPFDSGAAGSLRVTNAIRSRSFNAAISELKSMPSDQRLEWLSQYHQSGADQNSNGGAAMANYAELIGLIVCRDKGLKYESFVSKIIWSYVLVRAEALSEQHLVVNVVRKRTL